MLPAILKQSRYGKIAALLLLLIVGCVAFYGLAKMGSPKGGVIAPDGPAYDVGTTPTRQMKGFVDHFGNLVERQGKELSAQASQLDRMKGENSVLKKESEDLRSQLTEVKAILMAEQEKASSGRQVLNDLKERIFPSVDGAPSDGPPRIRKVTLPVGEGERVEHLAKRRVALPAGSFAEATLLTGVYAPTEGQAWPVKLRVDQAFVGPNRARIPIQESFLIGKAVGDPNSERVVVQLDRLSYVKPSGEAVEVPVNGYVVDDDGVQGIAGKYVWRAFDVASLAMLSGALSGGTDAAAARETTVQVSPLGGASEAVTGDPLRFAGFRGLSRASEGVEKLVVKRLGEIVPAVYVANGKRVTVCLIDGATIENLFLDEVNRAASGGPFTGLDLDR